MSAVRLLLVCGPLLCLSGCSWLPWLGRNLAGTPLEVVESCCFDTTMYLRAHRACRAVVASCPDKQFSSAYRDGFCHGFVDYVKRGGSGEPPAMPPMCYRYPVLRSPDQQQDIDDWFAGFRHGSAVAREQGWRDGVIVPIGRPTAIEPAQFKQEIIPTPGAIHDLPQPRPFEEQLPTPHLRPAFMPPADDPAPLVRLMWRPAAAVK